MAPRPYEGAYVPTRLAQELPDAAQPRERTLDTMAWTKERLEQVARTRLGGAKLVDVANREPFIHLYAGDDIRCMKPASGLTTALDPVLRACNGVWVGHGSGDADRAAADER